MRRIILTCLILAAVPPAGGFAQKKLSSDRLAATREFMQKHLWNAATGNYVRRADQPNAPGSDSWGITIVLDAYAYLVENGLMKPDELRKYYLASSSLYEKTNGDHGARILARQGNQIYVGGDDDMQWCAALVHCYETTKDSEYLTAARWAFNALIDMGFWIDGDSKGWAWNSADLRPNGVSTAYGALAAARLYKATGDKTYRQWVVASLNALGTPQVGFFPRDMMVAADAAVTASEVAPDNTLRQRAIELGEQAVEGGTQMLHRDGNGERNPTDVGDLADGLYHFYEVTHTPRFKTLANTFIDFFVNHRTPQDIAEHGFFSRYDLKGHPVISGAYLGVPLAVPFLPEVAEMLKLFAIAYKNG